MKLFESFRSAADKYGDTLAREMLTAGIPDKYILAACRFHQESNGKESDILAVQFRQWMSFVVPKDKTIDVNKLSYTEFTQIIDSARKFIYAPNCLYNDGTWSIGIWNSFQEAKLYPIENRWCICHSYKKWKEYVDIKGSVFYIVNCNDTNINQDYRHVCVEIEPNGEIYFWFTDNQSTHIDFLPNYFNCLPESIKEIITTESNTRGNKHYNITDTENNKTDKNESKNMNRKNTIRLTESELKRIISESVKRVLRESNENVITIGSPEYGEQGFRVELGDGGLGVKQFNVYAYNEQDALDAAVDYAEKKGWNFLFWDDDESVEEYPDDFITAGNYCHQLRSDAFIVRPLNESYRRRNRR